MKWFPVPSVPRCTAVAAAPSFGCFATMRVEVRGEADHVSVASPGRSPQAPRSPLAAVVRAAVRHGALDGVAHVAQVVRQVRRRRASVCTAIIPQPMSTPTAAGMIAPLRRDHAPDRRALSRVHVRHHRDPRVDEGQARAALLELLAPPRPRRARRASRP